MLSDDFQDRFGGVGRLFGNAGLKQLQAAHVCVIGVGGVGSWTVEGLARSGIGAITLIDLDDVCVTNVNRQLPALDGELGRSKVDVLADRVKLINPACRVTRVVEFFTKASAERMLTPEFDYVVDAIDGLSNKAMLLAECKRLRRRVITVGGAGGKRDATAIRSGDLGESCGDGLLKLVRRKLRTNHGYEIGTPRGKMHFDIRCVWSSEKPVFPWADGTCQTDAEPGSNLTLDCESGFGTAVFVTAAFGFAVAGDVVRQITETK